MIREIIQLGEKGGDIILKTFQKINVQKEKFKKPAKLPITTTQVPKAPDGEQEPELKKSSSGFAKNVEKATSGLNKLASSASSFDPTRFTTGVLDTMRGLANKSIIGLAGAVGGERGKSIAEATTSATDAVAELINTGASMATNSLSEIKNAQSQAIETLQKQSRMTQLGGETLSGKGYTVQEKSSIIESVVSRFGKIGKPLEAAINNLYKGSVDFQQALDVASGNFQALGTDQGYFLQNIMDSVGSLPPTLKQAMMAQMLPMAKINKQPQEITDIQASRAAMNNQDILNDINKARLTTGKGEEISSNLNKSLNDLNLGLVTSGTKLIGSLNTIVSGINEVVSKVTKNNQDIGAKAKK